MISKRARLIAYAAPPIFLIGVAVLSVTFPELADRLAIVFQMLVVAVGVVFVVGGLFRRDPSMLLTGAGFLIAMAGDYYSKHWMTLLGITTYWAGLMWMIKKGAATRRTT